MLLTIDIGNTTVTVGKFESDRLVKIERILTNQIENSSAISNALKSFAVSPLPEGVAICSVVPKLTPVFIEAIEQAFNTEPWIFDYKAKLGMRILYDNPAQLGADRLANAFAVREIYGVPAIAVDLGTATKFDVVNRLGEYAGGAIAPGVITSAQSLFSHGAQLFEIKVDPPPKYIATNTVEAMQSGIFYGAVGQINYLISQIKAELGEQSVNIIATGGLAEKMAPYLKDINKVDPSLTLQGIRLGWQRR
jgi:type III pantothenate kinase